MLFSRPLTTQLTVVVVTLGLWGCASFSSSAQFSSVAQSPPQRQQLPITAQLMVGNRVIKLETARTPEEQAIGLMNRTELAKNRGMIFPFSPPRIARFWMKNTLIPLDMIFVYQGKIKAIAMDVPPCRRDPCPVYGPMTEVDHVIELAAGQAKSLNLQPGDRLEVTFVKVPTSTPSSKKN
jgi:uncharacterized membrane protein (UPF0127 family)